MLTLALLVSLSTAAAPEPLADRVDALLATLKRPTPTETAFVELRESALLDRPLRLEGRLRHPDAATLVREVVRPYRERTTIRAERVEIARDGQPPRRFSLERAPELAGLLASFRALLGGDRALLEQHYALALESGAAAWTLRLMPRDPALARRVARIVLHGPTGELECMEFSQADSGGSMLLLGAKAEAAAKIEDAAKLHALCRSSAQ